MSDRLLASQIFNDGIIAHYNPRAGVGSISLEGSLTRVPFGRSAIDDAGFAHAQSYSAASETP